MDRIKSVFKNKDKNILISYITAGDPNAEKTFYFVLGMEAAGADIVEIGFPYKDSPADGNVIQKAVTRALNNDMDVEKCFELIKKLRNHTEIPLVGLIYYNQIFCYGEKLFLEMCDKVGLDGLVIPDMPIEDKKKWLEKYEFNVKLIPMIAPTSYDRIDDILKVGDGFVYCVSNKGVTGTKKTFDPMLNKIVNKIKKISDIPVAIGFGISDKETANKMWDIGDAVIIGSAIVNCIEEGIVDSSELQRVSAFIGNLKL